MKQVENKEACEDAGSTAKSAEAKTAFSTAKGIPGSYVFTKIPGKERPPIVVQHNVEGSGRPVANVALYCTRFKFAAYSSFFGLNGEEPDAWQKAVLALEGVTEMASYEHNGLYDITVKKATAFGWDEIEPKVLELLGRRHAELTLAEVMAKPPSPKVPIPMETSEDAEQANLVLTRHPDGKFYGTTLAESMCDDHSWAGQGRCPHCAESEAGR